jgi:Cft2 family RNA processing exonuclease
MPGTPARELTRVGSNKTFATAEGERKDVQCSVHEMSFAAHVDFPQNYDFISRVRQLVRRGA